MKPQSFEEAVLFFHLEFGEYTQTRPELIDIALKSRGAFGCNFHSKADNIDPSTNTRPIK